MNPYTSPETKPPIYQRRIVPTLVVFGFLSGFMILLAAGTFNAITTYHSDSNRTEDQRRIVDVLSSLDNGDETLQMFVDWKFTTIQFGVPIAIWSIAAWLHFGAPASHESSEKVRTNNPMDRSGGSAAS
jgi:hypothetical protein